MKQDAHRPRKRFGQNFLQDPIVIQKIVQALQLKPKDRVVEIGPGLGAITKPLLEQLDNLDVVELDRDLVQHLQTAFGNSQKKLIIHNIDALKFDFTTLAPLSLSENNIPLKKLKIIGNLPYNISTPLLFHLFCFCPLIDSMYFMLQKEVVDRLVAKRNHKQYGRLSIMAQYFCNIESLFLVDASSFYPPPKVQSAFVRLIPHPKLPFLAKDFELFQTIVRDAFNQRRKTLSNTLKAYLKAQDWLTLAIDPNLRPENLEPSDFVRISNYLKDKSTKNGDTSL